jgi:hypothetical protein
VGSLSGISFVLVAPPEPWPCFVTPLRRPVEPLVHTPERVKAACIGGVRVVDDPVGKHERAHTWCFAGVGGDVGACHRRELTRCRVEDFCCDCAVVVVDTAGTLLLLGKRRVKIVVEVAAQRRHPRECPAHAALVSLQRGNRGAGDCDHRHVVVLKVHRETVEAVRNSRTRWAAACVLGNPAQEGLFNTLMSMISQDSQDQLYEFTDKNGSGSGKMGSIINRLRGTPTIFNTHVIDDSRQVRYQEKNRRFIHVIPDTSTKKIHTAIDLIGMRYGLLGQEYEDHVVSNADKERAKEIVSIVFDKLLEHSKPLKPKESGVKISFTKSIAYGIHRGQDTSEWSMTVMDRMMRYLAIITKINMDSRPRIVDTETAKFYPISTFADLKETLELMAVASTMLRPYIANWYNIVFLPACKELADEPRKLTKEVEAEYGQKTEITIMQENEIGLTSKELAEKTYEILGMPLSVREVRDQYLYPLVNMGVINSTRSVINKSENLYSPVEDSVFSLFDNDADFRLKMTDCKLYPDKSFLEEEFRTIVKHEDKWGVKNGKNEHSENGNSDNGQRQKQTQRYRLLDADGIEIIASEMIDRYLNDPETCFIKAYPEFNTDSNNNKEAEEDKENTQKIHPFCPPVLRTFSNNPIEEHMF